jgi:hypothetical protein
MAAGLLDLASRSRVRSTDNSRGELVRRRLVDRRKQPRFEIVGELWGTIETVLRLPIRDVGLNGALLESHAPLAVDSVHVLAWDAEGRETSAQVRVRRIQRVTGHCFLIGVEFLARNPILTAQIQRWLCTAPGQAESGA